MERKRLVFDDDTSSPEWVATYSLPYAELDDSFDDSSDGLAEIVFNAVNFDIAVRYAQQYLRKMQTQEETQDVWATAEIISVEAR